MSEKKRYDILSGRLMRISLAFILVCVSVGIAVSQNTEDKKAKISGVNAVKEPQSPSLYRAIVQNGDTMPYVSLREVKVSATRVFTSKEDEYKFKKLKRDVKKVYPYALMAEVMLKEYSNQLKELPRRKQDAFIKKAEQEMKKEFEDELKGLTITQGKILMKLIDRQTGYTTYALVKKLRGSFSAFMWQSMARMFDSSMKSEYDPQGEDRMIEEIIIMIENGDL